MEEVHRFPNEPVQLDDGLYWDVLRLHHEVLAGLRHASRSAPDLRSVGIDAWGVDVGFLDAAKSLVANPVHHRDPRNLSAVERVHARIDPAALYARNGLQAMPFNTLYQLEAARRTPAFGIVRHVLSLPDLLGYWLTGVVIAERTHASTTGLLDPRTSRWDEELVRLLGLDATLLPPLADPGTVRGGLLPAVREATGLQETTVVTLVGSHDTASAVVAVPADRPTFAYISSGTWSLVGVETRAPILTEASREASFTNEGGVDATIRYLRNVTGLWLLQESQRAWERMGEPERLAALLDAAAALPRGGLTFDPDHGSFLTPGDMPARIAAALHGNGQPAPSTREALVRCILDSLAAAFASAIRDAARLSGRRVDTVHLVGGGARNDLLCRLTADACGLPVVAGPVEATALGNVLVQARAASWITGDLEALRARIRATQVLRRYEPGRRPATVSSTP